jgi:hypothetical protein
MEPLIVGLLMYDTIRLAWVGVLTSLMITFFNCKSFNCYGYYVTVASCLTSRFTSLRSFLEFNQSQGFVGCLPVSGLSWVFASLRSSLGVCRSRVFLGVTPLSGLFGLNQCRVFLGC